LFPSACHRILFPPLAHHYLHHPATINDLAFAANPCPSNLKEDEEIAAA